MIKQVVRVSLVYCGAKSQLLQLRPDACVILILQCANDNTCHPLSVICLLFIITSKLGIILFRSNNNITFMIIFIFVIACRTCYCDLENANPFKLGMPWDVSDEISQSIS